MNHLLAAFLLFVVPVWDYWYTQRLKRSTDPMRKINAYMLTAAWLWAASLLVWIEYRPGSFFQLHRQVKPAWLPNVGFAYGFVIAFMVGLFWPLLAARRSARIQAALRKQFAKLSFFLPFTGNERRWFAVVSITAGICEEVLYRGFLFGYFVHAWRTNVAVALAISAVAFGLGHGYQGLSGILATSMVAVVFTALYLITGSLLVPMVLHAVLDLRILLFPRELFGGSGPDLVPRAAA